VIIFLTSLTSTPYLSLMNSSFIIFSSFSSATLLSISEERASFSFYLFVVLFGADFFSVNDRVGIG